MNSQSGSSGPRRARRATNRPQATLLGAPPRPALQVLAGVIVLALLLAGLPNPASSALGHRFMYTRRITASSMGSG